MSFGILRHSHPVLCLSTTISSFGLRNVTLTGPQWSKGHPMIEHKRGAHHTDHVESDWLAWDEASIRRGFWERCMTTFAAPISVIHPSQRNCENSLSKKEQNHAILWKRQSWLYFLGGPRATKSLQHPYGEGRQIDIDTQRGFVICSILGADGGIPLPIININKERCSKHEVIRIKMVWNSKYM